MRAEGKASSRISYSASTILINVSGKRTQINKYINFVSPKLITLNWNLQV